MASVYYTVHVEIAIGDSSYPQATRPEGVQRNALRAQCPKSSHSKESAQA